MARKPAIQGWHPEDIKAALRKKHGSLTALCTRWGRAKNVISNTLQSPNYSKPTELLIAAELELSPHEIWPARWEADGQPKSRSSDFDHIPTIRGRNSQNAKAA